MIYNIDILDFLGSITLTGVITLDPNAKPKDVKRNVQIWYLEKTGKPMPAYYYHVLRAYEEEDGRLIYNFTYTNTVTGNMKNVRVVQFSEYEDYEDVKKVADAAFLDKYGKVPNAASYALTGYEVSDGNSYHVVDVVGDSGSDDSDNKGPVGDPDPFDDVTKPVGYNQGEIDVIEGLRRMLPFEQFRGFMKSNIVKYAIRYEHKGGIEDLDKIIEYSKRLKAYEEENAK